MEETLSPRIEEKIVPVHTDIFKELLEFAKQKFNVLMIGDHGIGKTEIMKQIFTYLGWKYIYFSGSTLDPYCDLIGIPSPEYDEVLKKKMLKYIRDHRLEDARAIIIDELNRCLTGDTLIQLTDGTQKAIKDLIGLKEFFVYSFDINTNKVVIGRGHSAVKTGTRKVYKITLSNGKTIRATDNHPFLMTNNQYKRVDTLQVGDKVRSLDKRLSGEEFKKNSMRGYEQVYQTSSNT